MLNPAQEVQIQKKVESQEFKSTINGSKEGHSYGEAVLPGTPHEWQW